MKTLTSTFAVTAALLMAVPATAQVSTGLPPVAGETALQYAQRINACDGAGVVDATFTQNRTRLSVQCPQATATGNNGMSGGLGTAIALGAGIVLIVAGAAGDSSSTVSTTN